MTRPAVAVTSAPLERSWPAGSKPRTLRNGVTLLPDLACLAVCAWLELRAFWQPGVSTEADFLLDVYRSFSLDQAWHSRQFFPRLSMDLNFGLGGPLFQYYPPVGSYVTLIFHWLGLGWVEATKGAFSLALLLAGLGAYCYAHWLYANRRAALVSGLAYMLAPYLLFCAYERGALAELLALSLLPWLTWTMHRLLRQAGRPWLWPAAALLALLVLTHNITALFAIPLLALYIGGMAWHEGIWRRLPLAALAAGLGLGLSAFYWLPALAERSYAQIERHMLGGDAKAAENLVPLFKLVQPRLAFDYWTSWIPALPMVAALLAGIGLLGLVVGDRDRRIQVGLLAALMAIPLILQWNASRPLYLALPLLRYIQYPWRLLGLASFFGALMVAVPFTWRRLDRAAGWAAVALVACLILYGSLRDLQPPPDRWPFLSSAEVSLRDHYERGRTGYWWLYNDYQLASMKKEIAELSWPGSPGDSYGLPPLQETPAIRVVAEGPAELRLQVESTNPFTLRLPRIFFPGWRVWVGDRLASAGPSGPWGLVTVDLPAGNNLVVARFGETPVRVVADALSALCLVIWFVGLARERPAQPFLVATVVALALLATLSLRHQGLGQPARRPVAFAANLQDEVALLGYHLPQVTLRPGDTLSLRLYWLARHTPTRDYRVFVHLVTPDDSARLAQSDEAPQLDSRPTGRWLPGELVVDDKELRLPPTIPPGTYRLLVGMYRAEEVQNLAVRSAPATLPGDRLDLGTIEIEGTP